MSNMNFTLRSNRKLVEEHTQDQIEKALRAVGIEAQRNVSMKAPVVTGRLAASITFATKRYHGRPDRSFLKKKFAKQKNNELESDDYKKLGNPDKNYVVVGTNVIYAKKVEFGSGENAHYLRRGMQEHASQYRKIFRDYLKEIE